jgi:hypothetical protein
LNDRSAVMPEDVQAVFPAVVGHRLELRDSSGSGAGDVVAGELIRSVSIVP